MYVSTYIFAIVTEPGVTGGFRITINGWNTTMPMQTIITRVASKI